MIDSFFNRLKEGLAKTRKILNADVHNLLHGNIVDEELINRLEEILIASDIGVQESIKIIDELKASYKSGKLKNPSQITIHLKNSLNLLLSGPADDKQINCAKTGPTVILVVGVNGSGKTTSIAKLAGLLKKKGKSVLLAAGDTFRAAAIEQLTMWANQIGIEIIKHQANSDPGAVAFDAAEAAISRKSDILIVDTAGRLHTKTNLMHELGKIKNVISSKIPDAPHETLLVIDASTGQNAITQAKLFHQTVPITGLFLAKLDGTAKGGIVVAIKNQLKLPVKFIGVGEKIDAIEELNPQEFVESLFDD